MKKVKVMQITPTLGSGGAERIVVQIAQRLNRQRFECAVLSISHRVGSDLEKILDDSSVPVFYLGKSLGFDGRTYRRLHRILKAYAPDVVHTHLHVLRYALPSIMLLKCEPCLHTVHNQAKYEVEPRARCIQRYALTHGVTPVAVSNDIARTLAECYGIRECRVVPNGIPTADYARPGTARSEWRARAGFRDDQVLFVCVARLAPQKNHALLFEAFSRGPGLDPRAQLVLIGEGSLRERLIQRTESLGLRDRIHLLGLRTDIPDALNAMDVFVLGSDWEGNPLSVMEAMASGLPIVSTAVGGVPDLLTDGREGLLLRKSDTEGFANAMTRLLGGAEMRHAMGFAAKQRAKQYFDVSRMIQDYEQLYEDLLRRSYRVKSPRPLRRRGLSLREV